jgi:hypothetical protein
MTCTGIFNDAHTSSGDVAKLYLGLQLVGTHKTKSIRRIPNLSKLPSSVGEVTQMDRVPTARSSMRFVQAKHNEVKGN